MRKKPPTSSQQVYPITLELPGGNTKTVQQKGSTLEVAERRALKFNPAAIGIKR